MGGHIAQRTFGVLELMFRPVTRHHAALTLIGGHLKDHTVIKQNPQSSVLVHGEITQIGHFDARQWCPRLRLLKDRPLFLRRAGRGGPRLGAALVDGLGDPFLVHKLIR